MRTNDAARFELPEMDVVLAVVRERIARTAGLPVAGLEWTQALRYAVGRRTRDAGLPPTRVEKRVLSQWLRGRAPRP